MSAFQKELESRKRTITTDDAPVELYSTDIGGLWLVNESGCNRLLAEAYRRRSPSLWRFDKEQGAFLIESFHAIDVAELQRDKWIMCVMRESKEKLAPIRIKFREYTNPTLPRQKT